MHTLKYEIMQTLVYTNFDVLRLQSVEVIAEYGSSLGTILSTLHNY